MVTALRRKVVSVLLTLLFASAMVFLITYLVPGDPAVVVAGEQATPEQIALVRSELGLDDPIVEQYGRFMWGVLHGDLGTSLFTREPVVDIVARTLPRTMELVVAGLVVAIAAGIPLGIAAAMRARTATDGVIRAVSTAGLAIPNFWFGLILVSIFALEWAVLPATGFVSVFDDPVEGLAHQVLPALAIGLTAMAAIARQTRSAMIEVLSADFVRTQRAMGVPGRAIVWQHALKNASIPVVTIIGLDISRLIGGAVVVETVFGISGLGGALVSATTQRDFPVVQGVILVVVFLVVIVNLLIDVLYTWLDPRIQGV
ncbi:ABC transporter permease [Pseudonocardia humida]|uniref:ABC transporter permease n=1 Tax=Pseudonocardia humida TaxID=2800819 RepID=A0ABT1A2K5_9PSEU|nr:ABC transporter permease [Pseudonocardia humida]MCO1657034.1 ABC transporter permease [Pseudonocardia humida]